MTLSERLPWRVIVLLSLLLLTSLHAVRIAGIHGWSDDGAAYLRHAMNLLDGVPYNQVPYTSLGNQPPVSLYPPALPLLLAPLVKHWGLDFRVFQTAMLAVFLLSLGASILALRFTFSPWIVLGAAAFLGVGTDIGLQNEHINSDFLGLLWIALLVWWAERLDWDTLSPRSLFWNSALGVGLLLAAIETRTVNAVLLGVFPVYSLWRFRRLTRLSLLVPGVTGLLLLSLRQEGGSSYLGQLRSLLSLSSLRRNVIQYGLVLADFLGLSPTGWQRLFAVAAMALALWGAACILRSQRPFWFVVAAAHGAVLILWPFSDPSRFSVPLLPLLLACFLYGLSDVAARLPRTLQPVVRIGIPGLALIVSAHAYWSLPPVGIGLNSPPSLELYEAVKRLTPADSLIALRKPRSLSLFTNRRTVAYSFEAPGQVRQELCAAHVTHVVSAPGVFPDDAQFLEPAKSLGGFAPLFQNSTFTLSAVTLCAP